MASSPRFSLFAMLLAAVGFAASPVFAKEAAGPFLYTDERGSTHMVQTFEEVPRAHRGSLRTLGGKKVEYQQRVTTMTPARAARAKRRARQLEAVPERRREQVIFYTASWCGSCKLTRAYLQEKGIRYHERDVEQPHYREELRAKTGRTAIPVVQYEDRLVIGWDPRAIDALGL